MRILTHALVQTIMYASCHKHRNVLPTALLESKVQRFEVRQGLLVFANERDAEIFASTSLPSSGIDGARKPNLVACEADAIDVRVS